MIRIPVFLAASLVLLTPVQTPDRRKEATVALEQKLHGQWKGGACQGDWTFRADGTYELVHYSPGNHTLTGTWHVRWDALPPTLVTICKASDYADHVGKRSEGKITRLDDEALVFEYPGGGTTRYERMKK